MEEELIQEEAKEGVTDRGKEVVSAEKKLGDNIHR